MIPIGLVVLAALAVSHGDAVFPQGVSSSTMHATGTFEVKMAPLAFENAPEAALLNRMSLDKVFEGDLAATAAGQMLAAGTSVEGSAVYVAVERVTGTLHGRSGAFTLRHVGTMDRGTPSLSIAIVPDSGAGDLAGISGEMTIKIEGGKHFYELTYTLAK